MPKTELSAFLPYTQPAKVMFSHGLYLHQVHYGFQVLKNMQNPTIL